jgi:hypothetical protein
MTGETQGFRVDPEKLLAVADKIAALLDDISGPGGTGTRTDFESNANTSHLQGALASLFPSIGMGDPFVESYNLEFTGLSTKYDAIVNSLIEVEASCRSTAEGYRDSESDSQAAINQTNDTGPGSDPGRV